MDEGHDPLTIKSMLILKHLGNGYPSAQQIHLALKLADFISTNDCEKSVELQTLLFQQTTSREQWQQAVQLLCR